MKDYLALKRGFTVAVKKLYSIKRKDLIFTCEHMFNILYINGIYGKK